MESLQRVINDYLDGQQCSASEQDGLESTQTDTYWTDGLSIAAPSSAIGWYHSALAVGATLVCSAGALMQYTETGLWSQMEAVPPRPIDTNSTEQAEANDADAVSIPPIASSQNQPAVAFSESSKTPFRTTPFTTAASSSCDDSTCKGLTFIEQRLPEIQSQIRELRAEMQQFQTQHTAQNLQTHRSILAHRSTDVARRQAELEVRSQQLDQQFASLTAALALHPEEANAIANVLQTDTSYQTNLQYLKTLEQHIAVEYSNPALDNNHLIILYTDYSEAAQQLRQIAQAALADYVATESLKSPDPLWQEGSYQVLLQELIDLSHLRQMLIVEQSTFHQIDARLAERRNELAVLLKQYAVMQRQLEGQNKILQQYISKRQELQGGMVSS